MNDRLLTLAGAVLAFALFFTLFFGGSARPDIETSMPVTTDRGSAGYAALFEWLKMSGFNVFSLRERYESLQDHPQLSQTGNLLLITVPQRYQNRYRENRALEDWIKKGNHVLLMEAQRSIHKWTKQARGCNFLCYALSDNWTSTASKKDDDEEEEEPFNPFAVREKPAPFILKPTGNHDVISGVKKIVVPGTEHRARLTVRQTSSAPTIRLLVYEEDEVVGKGQAGLAVSVLGQGRVFYMSSSAAFSNAMLGEGDNARLIGNIADYVISAGGSVIFDDMHQGVSVLYDPDAFYGDSRLYKTLWFMGAFWLIYVLGYSNRFATIRHAVVERVRGRDHVSAIGRFFARCLGRQNSAALIVTHFFNDVRRRINMPRNGEPVWNELGDFPRVSPDDVEKLKKFSDAIDNRKRVNLVLLHNLTRKIRDDMA